MFFGADEKEFQRLLNRTPEERARDERKAQESFEQSEFGEFITRVCLAERQRRNADACWSSMREALAEEIDKADAAQKRHGRLTKSVARAYELEIERFRKFCAEDYQSLPAEPWVLGSFLVVSFSAPARPGLAQRALAAITHWHELADHYVAFARAPHVKGALEYLRRVAREEAKHANNNQPEGN
jgi:hypothetical protein